MIIKKLNTVMCNSSPIIGLYGIGRVDFSTGHLIIGVLISLIN
ncbi:MAG: hypothetical protein ACI8WT_003436 [Clostridium sp.]|jgi:hypothetical protein